MTKLNKRIILGGVGVVIVATLAYVGYNYMYIPNTQRQQAADKQQAEVKDEAAKLNLAGDQDLSAAYILLLKNNKFDEAKMLFADKVAATSDKSTKQRLLVQQQSIAQAYGSKDQAISAALAMNDIESTHSTLDNIAGVYATQQNYIAAIDYQKQAIGKLQTGADEANKPALLEIYQKSLELYEYREANPITVSNDEVEGYAG